VQKNKNKNKKEVALEKKNHSKESIVTF